MNAIELANAPTARLTRQPKSDAVRGKNGLTRMTWWLGCMNLPKANATKARRNCGRPVALPSWAAEAIVSARWD